MNKANYVGYGLLGITAALVALAFTPTYILAPNKEASSADYRDAESVFDKQEEDSIFLYKGSCPALSVATAKALLDKKLTAAEVHDLRKRAQELFRQAMDISSKNAALRAAGVADLQDAPDCPRGNELFRS